MRKILGYVLCLLLIGFTAHSGMSTLFFRGTSAGQSIDYTQDFNDSTEPGGPAGWSETAGSPNFDQDTTGLGMEGAQCLGLPAGAQVHYDTNFGVSEIWTTFWFRYDGEVEASEYIFYAKDSGDATIMSLQITNGAAEYLGCCNNSGTCTGSTELSINTTYKIRLYIKNDSGVGNDGTITADLWDGDSWNQACTRTDGTNENAIDYFRINNGADTENMYFDYLQKNSSEINEP